MTTFWTWKSHRTQVLTVQNLCIEEIMTYTYNEKTIGVFHVFWKKSQNLTIKCKFLTKMHGFEVL